jgi:hypothetical protein
VALHATGELRDPSRRLHLVYNPSQTRRNPLVTAVSSDDGAIL